MPMTGTAFDPAPGGWLLPEAMSNETIIVERHGPVTSIRLNRPQALNAFNRIATEEVISALLAFDRDPDQLCAVLTGSPKAFAAGADISEMAPMSFAEVWRSDFGAQWDKVARIRKPWIAAVSGYALGGGAEVAMMADIIIASSSARFGQPEVTLGISPGWGGTQRLVRAVGKSKAMDLCLSGRFMDAAEAEACGLVARVVDDDCLIEEAMKLASAIAAMPQQASIAVKELLNASYEFPLSAAIQLEGRMRRSLQNQNVSAAADREAKRQ